MSAGLDEAIAQQREELELCTDIVPMPSGAAKARRILAALLRAQRVEAAAREVHSGPEGCVTTPACGACAWCRLGAALAVTP